VAGFSDHISLLILLGFFVLQFVFAFILGEILLKFATNLGVRNHGDGVVRWTATTKPSLGGILFFFAFLLSIVFYLVMLSENSQFNNLEFLGIVLVCTMGFVMGLADDAYNTKPWLKFFVQILCGVVSIICGNHINIFSYQPINYFLTIFWFVGIMNSLNMLDNMDAITSSVVSVACLFMLVVNYYTQQLFVYDSILLLGVTASVLAFLRYNWHPSKMYMGDSGSQFLGGFMAYLALKILWNVQMNVSSHTTDFFMLLLPVSFFIITISDTTTVSINRLLKKRSPFIGGKDHTTHHLVYAGLKQSSVAIIYILISILCCSGGFLIYYFGLYNNKIALISFSSILLAIFISLFIVTKKFKNDTE
jgi:UDP-GlcNAc:undecaprenyl-phosphate GlcNAc-1-phosphate transferase